MIRAVHREETEWNEPPWKFEAGTSNIADVIGFGAVLSIICKRSGMSNVKEHETRIAKEALESMSKIKGIKIYGPMDEKKRGAVISFNVGNIHAHDVASILDSEGVADPLWTPLRANHDGKA